jgi:serine/threonine-protein kinase
MSEYFERLKSALSDRYAIDREIGRGGMAVVYLAEDLKHGRQVAIKVLQPSVSATLGTERFLKEIETAARLQHPHILPLYDSGEADGFLYYVMPYVEGDSLRDRIDREGQLPVEEAVRLAREVADGLGYAHAEGVIHRDIKPGNIMLQGGHAVIADFGIAQAVDEAGGERLTATGVSTGSPVYMSPEQARGSERLDGRTDLYSLGCVLYEMLAGEAPFTGGTRASITARKEMEAAPDLRTLRDTVPEAVDAAVRKALAKAPADRFQTAGEFGEALHTQRYSAATARGPNRSARRRLVFASVLTGVVLTVVTIAVLASRAQSETGLRVVAGRIAQVTNDPGVEFQPALSPDGREVAYLTGRMSNPKLAVRSAVEIGDSESLLDTEVSGIQMFPRWSSETAIRLVVCENRNMTVGSLDTGCSFREMGARGGVLRTIPTPRRASQLAWSRDGTRAAFFIQDSLYTYHVDRPEPELVAVQPPLAWLPHSIAWSPDGKRIAYVNGNQPWLISGNTSTTSIWVVDAEGGEPFPITSEDYLNMSPQWLPDSQHLLFMSDRDGPRGIYSVAIGPRGPLAEPRVVAAGTDAHTISVSADGTRLAYSKFLHRQNIWSLPVPESEPLSTRDAEAVTTGNQVIESAHISSDGEWLAYESNRRGNMDIYRQPLKGGEAQLVADAGEELWAPEWSPAGTELVVFDGDGDIQLIAADGGKRSKIVASPGFDVGPTWSPDGLAIAFHSQGERTDGIETLWVMRRNTVGGAWDEPLELTDIQCLFPRWSPDGVEIVCSDHDAAVVVSADGEILRRIDLAEEGFRRAGLFRFSNDGASIRFGGRHSDGRAGIWSMAAEGGEPRQLVIDDPARPIFWLSANEFGGRFYFVLSEYESDIYVMDLEY